MSARETVPHVVYRCYDAAGRLLYIGCSNSIRARLDAHEDTSWWWPEVATVRNLLFPNRDTALEKERQAIFHERPRCNVKGRWYRRDPRTDWSAQDYINYHETVRRTANGIYGTHTSKLLSRIEVEANERHGVLIPRTWAKRSA